MPSICPARQAREGRRLGPGVALGAETDIFFNNPIVTPADRRESRGPEAPARPVRGGSGPRIVAALRPGWQRRVSGGRMRCRPTRQNGALSRGWPAHRPCAAPALRARRRSC